jgi:hypothetical protein
MGRPDVGRLFVRTAELCYEPYYQCKEDRLLVMFHLFMLQRGYMVADNIIDK